MSLTFRQIGARNKTQGGASFSNLTIGTRLASNESMIISGNDVLIKTVSGELAKDQLLVQRLQPGIENLILSQQISYENIARVIERPMVTSILGLPGYVDYVKNTDRVKNGVLTELTTNLINDANFIKKINI
jgi:hypothetical protein